MNREIEYHIEKIADLVDDNTDQETIESFYILAEIVDFIDSSKRQLEIKKRQLADRKRELKRQQDLNIEINQRNHYRGSATRGRYVA